MDNLNCHQWRLFSSLNVIAFEIYNWGGQNKRFLDFAMGTDLKRCEIKNSDFLGCENFFWELFHNISFVFYKFSDNI